MNDSHERKEVIRKVQLIDTAKEGVHYSEQGQKNTIMINGVEERLMDNLMNPFESSNQHTDVLTEEKETEQQTELLPKEDKAQNPYVFYFNKCFVSAGLVADAGRDLVQMGSLTKKEEDDSIEEFNPWNKDVELLEKMLNNHHSIMKEGKDDREAAKMVASKARASK